MNTDLLITVSAGEEVTGTRKKRYWRNEEKGSRFYSSHTQLYRI